MNEDKKVISANEFQLIDEKGNVKATLSANDDGVALNLAGGAGKTQVKLQAGNTGLSSLSIYDEAGKEKLSMAIDEHGAHVHMAGEGKQESYLFLKNSGASGLVLTDKDGNRRLEAKVGPDGEPDVAIFPLNGEEKKL